MALQKDGFKNGITVIGAGTTGYLSTVFLCKNYPDVKVTWIYPENNNPIGVGEATVPAVTEFLKELGITPETIIKEVNGSVKLGIRFDDFLEPGSVFYHPFGNTDLESGEIKEMMKTDKVPDNILEYSEIATHFDVNELMNYLNDKIIFKNLSIIRKTVTDLNEIEDSFIVDCTGFNHSLSKNSSFKTITDKIPNNKAIVYRDFYTDRVNQQKPYTVAKAMDHGWIWHISLKDKLSLGYVYDSTTSDVREEFIKYVKSIFGSCDESKVFDINMVTGRNEKHIIEDTNKTVITLGLSSFFIEPLESTGLYLVVYGIRLLNEYLQGNITAEQYNETYNYEFDIILDFIIAHYKFSKRDNEYWNKYKELDIELYRENNIFPKRSWKYILDGLEQINYEPEIDYKDIIKIHKSKKYTDWLYEKNSK